MARVREKQLQKRKQETLDVAIRRLIDGGYTNLNMDELADEVGISKPTLYQDFNSKEELVAQAIVQLFEKMEAHLDDDTGLTPYEQLERFLWAQLKSRSEQRNFMNMVDAEVIRSIMHRHPYPLERIVATRNRLEGIVRKAQEQGEIDPELPSRVVVDLIFSLQGVIAHPGMRNEPPRSDREIAQAIESAVLIFRRGVRAPVNTSARWAGQ